MAIKTNSLGAAASVPRRDARWGFSELTGGRRAWPRIKASEQHGRNSGQEYAVKSSPTPIDAIGAVEPTSQE